MGPAGMTRHHYCHGSVTLGSLAPSLPYLAGCLSMSTSSITSRLALSMPEETEGVSE